MRTSSARRLLSLTAVTTVVLFLLVTRRGSQEQLLHGQNSPSAELLPNLGFEDNSGSAPRGWIVDQRNANKGRVSVEDSGAKAGNRRLVLRPNANNQDASQLLGIGQALPLDQVRGKTVRLSGWLSGEGGATAVLGLFALRGDGAIVQKATVESNSSGEWQQLGADFEVPDSSEIALVILLCQVNGTRGMAAFDDIAVTLGGSSAIAATRAQERTQAMKAMVRIDAARDIRRIPRTIYGTNLEWIYDGYGIWNARARRLNSDVVRLSKDLRVSLLRYPGGFFADFYDWRDGIGPRRGIAEHRPGGPRSPVNFGTDEVMEFAEATGADLHFIANIVTGTPQQAAEWVRYTNSPRKRRVSYWELGNESYGKDPSAAHSVAGALSATEYIRRYLAFAKEMRQIDGDIRLMAIGGANYGRYNVVTQPDWNQQVLSQAGRQIDLLAVHNAYYPLAVGLRQPDVRELYRALFAAPLLIRGNLETLSGQIERFLPPERADDVGLAITEWGPFFEADLQTPLVDHVKTLGSAIFVASVLKVFCETPKVQVANFFKLVDNLFMGWIGVRNGAYVPKAPYLAFSMFTQHFGEVLVQSETRSPRFNAEAIALVERVSNVDYLETLSSRSADGRTLFVLAINKHLDQEISASVSVSGFGGVKSGRVWTLAGTGLDANTGTQMATMPGQQHGRQLQDSVNPRFYQGGRGEVAITSRLLERPESSFEYRFPRLSVTVIELSR